ncbi:MAG: ArsR/SmtB family transcription factor [Pararhizobium sp.]
MLDKARLDLESVVETLKAAGENTRMRLLALLSAGDLTVTDLTEILGQSQPRISRHLKLLREAGLVERYQEGAWAYFRLTGEGPRASLSRLVVDATSKSDPVLARDGERLAGVKQARAEKAQAYFSRNARSWDQLRTLHIPEEKVEAKLKELIGAQPFDSMLDLGTGTGRILQLFEGIYRRAIGIDASRDMLTVARANLDKAGITRASVRHGDIFNLPLDRNSFDLVTIHQVLHFVEDPAAAIAEAARMLRPAGRLAIIDFAPHDLEHLRADHAHVRLGFSHESIAGWLGDCELDVETVVDLAPDARSGETLTVTIWLARDRRLLIADAPQAAKGVA